MKTINFWDIPNTLKFLTFDGDKTDLRLHSDCNYFWGAEHEKDYKRAAAKIDAIERKGKGWTVYAWYDVSSFEYWMQKQEEQNYIAISISFDTETIEETELTKLKEAVWGAEHEAEQIAHEFNFNPSTY